MQEEFEKKVQERVHTFGLQPSPQVWDDINAVLGKRKHRRIFIGWWILLGLVMAGGGILFYEKDNILRNELNQHPVPAADTLQQNNIVQSTPVTPAGSQKATQDKAGQNTTASKQPIAPTQQGLSQAQQNVNTPTNQSYTKTNPSSTKKITNIAINSGDIAGTKNSAAAASPPAAAGLQKDNQPAEQTVTSTAPQAAGNSSAANPVVPSPTAPVDDKQTAQNLQVPSPSGEAPPNKTPSATGEKINIKTIATARHQWFFTVGGGTTQTTSHSSSNNTEKNFSGNSTQNVLALTSPAAYKYSIGKPGTGYHINAGFAYQYKLSPHIRLTGGLQAAYLSNTQKTGSYIKNSFYVAADTDNSGSLNVTTNRGTLQSSYYLAATAGSEYTIVNKAWQLQVPVNISYVITPRSKTKFLIDAGGSYGWMFSSQWLIQDSRYEKLYYNKTLLNNHIISWQAGPAVELHNNIRFGIQYQQSFTTFAKGYITPKMHWQNISINAGIPLNIKFRKGKK